MSTKRKAPTEDISDEVQEELHEYADALIETINEATRSSLPQNQGAYGVLGGRPPLPDNLTDMLMYRLSKTKMQALCDALIRMALNSEEKVSFAVQRQSIQDIFDRIEGKARQTIIEARAHDDPLIELMKEAYGPTPEIPYQPPTPTRIAAAPGKLVEAPVREATSDEAWS